MIKPFSLIFLYSWLLVGLEQSQSLSSFSFYTNLLEIPGLRGDHAGQGHQGDQFGIALAPLKVSAISQTSRV
jgi:hypothetical protein